MPNLRLGRWVVVLLLALELCAVIWFAGPLASLGDARPFAGPLVRTLAMGAILIAAIAGLVLFELRAQHRELEAGGHDHRPDRDMVAAELALLRMRFKAALRRMRHAGAWLHAPAYRHPWYLMLGPPCSDRATVLAEAGLSRMSAGPIDDPAPDDWADAVQLWTGHDAVVIDTSDHFLGGEAVADTLFRHVLRLVKRLRPQQPLNGIILLLGLADLAARDEPARTELGSRLRRRLEETIRVTGSSPPVYLLLTEVDHVPGFTDSFAHLEPSERGKPLGVTLPFTADKRSPAAPVRKAKLASEIETFVRRLARHALHQIGTERDIRHRARMLEFPAQLAVCLEAVTSLARSLTAGHASGRPVRLRGVYLVAPRTAEAGEGWTLDLMLPAMRQNLAFRGSILGRLPDDRPPTGAGYFLARLVPDVLSPEAGLVTGRLPHWRASLGAAGLVVTMIGLFGLALLCRSEFSTAEGRLVDLHAATTHTDSAIAAGRLDRGGPDLTAILPHLDALGASVAGAAAIAPRLPTFGGRDALAEAHRAAYARALDRLLLPRLILHAEERLAGFAPSADDARSIRDLFETLKVYLMLGARGPRDADAIAAWVAQEAAAFLPARDPEALARLDSHVRSLTKGSRPHLALDEELITAVRRKLSLETLIERGFSSLQSLPGASDLPPWRAVDVAGPLASRLLIRPSGKALGEGIPGLYTRAGFFTLVAPALDQVATRLARDGWVIQLGTDEKDIAKLAGVLKQEIADDYFVEYINRWDSLLADLTVAPTATLQQAAAELSQLAGPASPLDSLYRSAAHETDLDQPWQKQAASPAGAAKPTQPSISGHPVATHFAWLRDLVGPADGGPSRLKQLIDTLGELGRQLAQAAALPPDAAPAPNAGPSAAGQLLDMASTLPPPLAHIVSDLTANVAQIRSSATTGRLQNAWRDIEPFCRLVTSGRYPFVAKASDTASLEDFTLLFGPQGRLARFFAEYLMAFVDRSGPSWRVLPKDGMQVGVDQAALEQFQRAARIRDIFFNENPDRPSLRFGLEPLRLDAAAETMTFSVGGQTLLYRHDPPRMVMMQWPAPDGQPTAELQFTPWLQNEENGIEMHGPWAFLQLVDAGQPKREGKSLDRFILRYTVGSRSASLRLSAASIINPFGSQDLRQFRCPSIQ
ncbi:type VI secretion system membrane subunit TssM [Chelatococcus sp. GCM10030263]|uniref:type VI secretion system membrane subunit TssM n=1 Tax=Chelatococcus sp. GCM10030263 TaxID=3273387 RepID=UPI00362455C8